MLLVGKNLTGVKPFKAYVKETSTMALNVEQGNHLSSTTYGASEQDVWYAAADLSIYSTKHLREHSKLFVTEAFSQVKLQWHTYKCMHVHVYAKKTTHTYTPLLLSHLCKVQCLIMLFASEETGFLQ